MGAPDYERSESTSPTVSTNRRRRRDIASGYANSRSTNLTESTSRRRRNNRGLDPQTLAYYGIGTQTYNVLVRAKEIFAAETFSAGLFFFYKKSPHLDRFTSLAADAIGQASIDLSCMYPNLCFVRYYQAVETTIFRYRPC